MILKSLTGSRSYNVHEENSDYDFIILLNPTDEQLFENKRIDGHLIEGKIDSHFFDIRKIPGLIEKGDFNIIHSLFTEMKTNSRYDLLIRELVELRNKISYSMRRETLKRLIYAAENDLNKEGKRILVSAIKLETVLRSDDYRIRGPNPDRYWEDNKYWLSGLIKEAKSKLSEIPVDIEAQELIMRKVRSICLEMFKLRS